MAGWGVGSCNSAQRTVGWVHGASLESQCPAEIAKAYRAYGYTLKVIAAHLGVPYSTIRRRLHHYETSRDKRRWCVITSPSAPRDL